MLRIFKYIFGSIWSFLEMIFTGGKYGAPVQSHYSNDYAKQQEQRRKEFEKFGVHGCKICDTKIPGNKSYCGACYNKYKRW